MEKKTNGIRFRVEKTNNYTVMSNQHFKVTNMSLGAKGLLSLMLSLPDDWEYSIGGLTSLCKESYSAVKSKLNELKDLGYLEVNRINPTKENGGLIKYEYVVYENSKKLNKLKFARDK